METLSDYVTEQFYAWDYRGRGWHVQHIPVLLEPPFMPYIRHKPPLTPIDDGKRHTVVSSVIEKLSGSKKEFSQCGSQIVLDYSEMEVFPFDDVTELIALRILLPKERTITPERMKALLTMLPSQDAPLSFEIIGTATEIIIQFVCRSYQCHTVEQTLKAYFPECTIKQDSAFLEGILTNELSIAMVDFGLSKECFLPFSTSKNYNIDPLTALFGALEHLECDQRAGVQILFSNTLNPWAESIQAAVTMPDGTSFFDDLHNAPKLATEKTKSPLYAMCLRVFAQDDTFEESNELFERIAYPILNAAKGQYNQLIPLPDTAYDINTRAHDIYYRQSHRLGMLVNADELVQLLHFPSESIVSTKLFPNTRKTKATPSIAKHKPFVLGNNSHNGITEPVTIGFDERVKHMHIIGATGTGKSTLIANLILQDCAKGLGLVLFDPHGDLVDDVIANIPQERLEDIVLIDPSDTDYPIGINILQAHHDLEKEILASDLVASFKRNATTWGDQIDSVLGNAIIAMLESTTIGTLHDLRRFLLEPAFRNRFLQTVSDPSVIYYWHKEYPLLKTSSVGSILTRLDSLLRPRTIRNMLVQKTGLDFETLINSNKIILVKLSQGLIGAENSYTLGSLILSKIHQAALSRQNKATRQPFFIYLDEFQNFITPSIADMLSGVRKYNVGLVLSHQDLQQLQRDSTELLNSVLGNTYTKIVFRVGEPDAKKLADSFASFDALNLQNLGRGEAIVRIEQPQFDCALETQVLPSITAATKAERMAEVQQYSRAKYARTRLEVEDMLRASFAIEEEMILSKPLIAKTAIPLSTTSTIPVSPTPIIIEEKLAVLDTAPAVLPQQQSTHRYLQTLIKKMAEAKGYTATLEVQTPQKNGSVDVLLSKDKKTIAIEICVTTDAQWEMHNIQKCIIAGYDTIVAVCGDIQQLKKNKQKCIEGIPDYASHTIHFFTPDLLLEFLDQQAKHTVQPVTPESTILKGYRVNVTYDAISQEDMQRKRVSVARVVMNSINKRK